jgi:hypothetical protein
MSKIYVGDIGTDIRLDCGSDISTATETNIEVLKPDGSTETWTGTIVDDNFISHITVDGDLDMKGSYKVQAAVTMPAWEGRGETTSFIVYDVFK